AQPLGHRHVRAARGARAGSPGAMGARRRRQGALRGDSRRAASLPGLARRRAIPRRARRGGSGGGVTQEVEHPSAMTEVFGWLPRYVADRLTRHVHLDERAVAQVRAIGEGGTIVYVLRNRSLLDYLLINWLFVREGLPLARFANGVSTGWFLPLIAALRRMSNR